MKIFVAGGTGAIGRPLIAELLARGHAVVALTRSPERARAFWEQGVVPAIALFKTGHRIRLEISSSNFPHYDRNPNTGRRFGMNSEFAVADQTIYHDPEHPSKVVLPVMPSPVAQQ